LILVEPPGPRSALKILIVELHAFADEVVVGCSVNALEAGVEVLGAGGAVDAALLGGHLAVLFSAGFFPGIEAVAVAAVNQAEDDDLGFGSGRWTAGTGSQEEQSGDPTHGQSNRLIQWPE
jgi:hypothetical protein